MPTRTNTPVTKSKTPATLNEWNQLLSLAIKRAERLRDPRVVTLRAAMTGGKAEATLRRMGVIGETDLQREFPDAGP